MKWVFKELSRDTYAADQIRQQANLLGLKCSRMNFLRMVRNPVYCGKLIVREFKEEKSFIVDGLHEPLVSEALFYDVQDVLNGRKRKVAARWCAWNHYRYVELEKTN